jgi:hypothetical protein
MRRRVSDSAVKAASAVVRASARKVSPTLETEVADALIAASRRSVVDPHERGREGAATDHDDDDDDLPGPRESSADLGFEARLALAELPFLNAEEPSSPGITPRTPKVSLAKPAQSGPGIAATQHLISAALADAASSMPVAELKRTGETPLSPTSTPGDFVIPIEVTETLHEGKRPNSARGVALFAAAGLVVLLGMGSFVALRTDTAARSNGARAATVEAPSAPPTPVTLERALPAEPTSIATTPAARPTQASSGQVAPPAPPTSLSSRPDAPAAVSLAPAATARPAPRAPVAPPAPAPPPAKPKRSLYDPEGL